MPARRNRACATMLFRQVKREIFSSPPDKVKDPGRLEIPQIGGLSDAPQLKLLPLSPPHAVARVDKSAQSREARFVRRAGLEVGQYSDERSALRPPIIVAPTRQPPGMANRLAHDFIDWRVRHVIPLLSSGEWQERRRLRQLSSVSIWRRLRNVTALGRWARPLNRRVNLGLRKISERGPRRGAGGVMPGRAARIRGVR